MNQNYDELLAKASAEIVLGIAKADPLRIKPIIESNFSFVIPEIQGMARYTMRTIVVKNCEIFGSVGFIVIPSLISFFDPQSRVIPRWRYLHSWLKASEFNPDNLVSAQKFHDLCGGEDSPTSIHLNLLLTGRGDDAFGLFVSLKYSETLRRANIAVSAFLTE